MFSTLFSTSNGTGPQYLPLSEDDIGQQKVSRLQENISAKSSLRLWKFAALCELFVIAALAFFMFNSDHKKALPYSLVRDIIKYETRVFHNSVGRDITPYQGPPSPELDARWSNIYEGAIFKISKKEARSLPNKTSALPGDPEHYISSLSVFHHLHCLNFMRKTLYPDYYPGMDLKNATIFEHQEHCIDILRQAHMCLPDTTAAIWQWHESIQETIPTWDIAHTCVDYSSIQQWAMDRALYEYDSKVFVEGNPIHHPIHH